jgi:putative oxidoreductase
VEAGRLGSITWGLPLRRLFSNFADGGAGFGLLLIRIVAGASLVVDGKTRLHPGEPMLSLILGVLAFGDGALLVAGLFTPLAGFLAVALSLSEILVYHQGSYPGILLAAMGAGAALVGPGAFSVDALLFGLKKIDIGNSR